MKLLNNTAFALWCTVILAVVSALEEPEIDNNILPYDENEAQHLETLPSSSSSTTMIADTTTSSTTSTTSTSHTTTTPTTTPTTPASSTTPTIVTTTTSQKRPTPSPPRRTDIFSRLIDDIIQIPISALRAVNVLLNNLTQRRHVGVLRQNNVTVNSP